MSETKWTPAQKEAIYTDHAADGRGCNILVNAAAGSGKTAVLVERIIQKLIPNAENPETIDVDRLLVVTFTNAAAAEMQKRISDALLRELADADAKKAEILQRQIGLVHHADITTIDAFCLQTIRNYFHLLDIDPNFTIISEAEISLMQDEAAEELFEELYAAKDAAFTRLLCRYSDGRDDRALAELVQQIYHFMQSEPDPADWLQEKAAMYKMEDGENSPWIQLAMAQKETQLAGMCNMLLDMISQMAETCGIEFADRAALLQYVAENPPGTGEVSDVWKKYYAAVCSDYMQFSAMRGLGWDETCDRLRAFDKMRFDSRGIELKELAEEIKGQLNTVRTKKLPILLEIFDAPLAEKMEFLRETMYPMAEDLVGLVLQFDQKYREKKDKKNVLEFSDVEHLCLRLFREQPAVAAQFREKYIEILMDEYQDSNALQEAIFTAISRGNNFFMVGDMKQSIYRFRSGDPTIFKAKNDTYDKTPGAENRKIILSKNFRSRGEVLSGVNAVFTRIMSEAAGEMEYDKDQQLYLGDETYEPINPDYRPVCMAIEGKPTNSDEEPVEDIRLEARCVARKIRELKDSGFKVRDTKTVTEQDGNGNMQTVKKTVYRELENRDIVILMSSYKSAAHIFTEELESFGIPCFAQIGSYFERNEIKIMLSLVKIINNPYQDIPLLSVLRSPIGRFNDSELAQIRTYGGGRFYAAMRACAKMETSLGAKCAGWIAKLSGWRDAAKYMSSDKLLWTLYEETDFYAFVGALDGGEDAQANLRLLFERAKLFEGSGYKGLFNFARYINRIRKKETDLSAADLLGENHDVVRLMTIHKSKGLEFPVVFLSGTGKSFYNPDATGSVILHKNLGLGMEYINFEESYKTTTLARNIIKQEIHRENISEEIRKLYVALTRAKEKLFVTGFVKGRNAIDIDHYAKSGLTAAEQSWQAALPKTAQRFDAETVLQKKHYLDWVAPVAMQDSAWIYEPIAYEEAVSGEYIVTGAEQDTAPAALERLVSALDFQYPYTVPRDMPVKISVTELKQNQNQNADLELREIPDFLAAEKPLTGAAAGTALHTAMQKIPPTADMDIGYVQDWLIKLTQTGVLTEAEAACVQPEKILRFYQSPLGKRLLASPKVWREQPFEIVIPAEEAGYAGTGETVILQGVIDCCFAEDDALVLVDYKTDYYKKKEEVLAKYTIQLEYYAKALVQILKKPVKNKYLYLFYGEDVIE